MSKTSPKQRLITFKNWLSTVRPVKINKGKKKRNEKNNSKYRTTSRS